MDKEYSKQVFFCSTASRYYKENLHGTAANYKCFIMVEHADPFPLKPTNGHLDKVWLKSLDKLATKRSGKLLLIRNKSTRYGKCRIIYVDCIKQRYFVLTTSTHEAFMPDIPAAIESSDTVWEYDPFFVICTNGKKDKCCAKFGFPVFKFFENMPLPFSYETFECTHIGGDRFAANVALMPFGIYYGRVEVEDVHDIIRQTASGSIHFNNYRGLCIRSFFAQAVECHLRAHLNDFRIDFPITISGRKSEGDNIEVFVTTDTYGAFTIQLKRVVLEYPYNLTCTSPQPENIIKYELVAIEPS